MLAGAENDKNPVALRGDRYKLRVLHAESSPVRQTNRKRFKRLFANGVSELRDGHFQVSEKFSTLQHRGDFLGGGGRGYAADGFVAFVETQHTGTVFAFADDGLIEPAKGHDDDAVAGRA